MQFDKTIQAGLPQRLISMFNKNFFIIPNGSLGADPLDFLLKKH